ncbi:hypothetical protein THAOC_19495 [Thalassiosira oceanica]|uniref:Uncharacterized protein n=1 Tax=Thalassiosira oceanica TaxID=159749 RepID=K0SGV6_THAOC|nr:hypothetical protein THAOC_19495 [Thalassiosira oceanica]|eukprot:EJK60201.1 hypothetical protein THAOC_19495 [Thalassiosira oceanica]
MVQALNEVITMSGSDEIAIGLQFEAELVDYFEVTYQWHAHPGELSIDRSGFRTMELPHLLFGYIMPWWETAVEEPKKCFPKTFRRIEILKAREEEEAAEAAAARMEAGDEAGEMSTDDVDEVEDDEAPLLADIKREQIMLGIQAGYDEISKLYQRMLKAPMIFLGTLDPEVGPSIFRAILALVSEEGVDLDEQTTEYDDGETWEIPSDKPATWGKFEYNGDGETRPLEEKIWYDLMKSDSEFIAKWFKLLGLHRGVVHRDLRRFSHESTAEATKKRDPESTTRLRDFYDEYPVLFSSYRAMFALMPSATRIVESLHGMMRHSHDAQISLAFYNAKMRYNVKMDYEMKEKRRVYVRKRAAAAKGGATKSKPAKHADRKKTQAMVGPQLMELIDTYSAEAISSLPDDIKKKISIKEINKKDARTAERKLALQKRSRDEQLRPARVQNRGEVPVDELLQQGRSTRTKHTDEHAMRPVREENSAIDGKLVKTYWQRVPADQFKMEAFRVFPTFESPEAWKAGKTKMLKKTGEVYDIGAHMNTIKEIADKTKPNSLNDTDVSEMEKYDILRMFVKFEQSVVGSQNESASSTAKKRMKAIFQHIGREIKNSQRFKSKAENRQSTRPAKRSIVYFAGPIVSSFDRFRIDPARKSGILGVSRGRMRGGTSQISRPHFFKTKIVINRKQVTVIFGVTSWAIWDPGVSLALASSRRAERNTATSLDVKLIGWARTGSAEGRRTGRGLRGMPGEGARSVWLGSVCLTSDWKGGISISGVRGVSCRISANSEPEQGNMGADRRAAVRRGRAYTTIHDGRWCSRGPIPRGDRIRGEAGGRPAGWELGCIARASAFEGRTNRETKPTVNEDNRMRRWTGRLVFRNRPGHSNAAGGRDLLLTM